MSSRDPPPMPKAEENSCDGAGQQGDQPTHHPRSADQARRGSSRAKARFSHTTGIFSKIFPPMSPPMSPPTR